MTQRWYCVQTKIGKEITASVYISGMGFSVYYPVRLVDVKRAGKIERQAKPLFPRYIFVSNNHPNLTLGPINNARGVANKGLFCDMHGRPQTISDEIIEGIRARENVMKVRAGELKSGYAPGDTFKIAVGKYADFEAQYVGEEKGEIQAIVHLFGRGFVVKLPIEALPIGKRDAA